MKKTQKRFFLIMTILEALAIAGCFVFNYFTVNKLGMVRWVNFNSMKWEKAIPVTAVKAIVIAALIVVTVILIWIYSRHKADRRKLCGFMVTGAGLISLVTVGYILFVSLKAMRSYYFICVLLITAAVLQLIKTAIGLILLKKAEEPAA